MRNLTTADVAFLLCTSKHGAGYRLTLETDYGLVIHLGADGSISATLRSEAVASDDLIATPISPTPAFPVAGTSKSHLNPAPVTASIDEILISPQTLLNLHPVSPAAAGAANPFHLYMPTPHPPKKSEPTGPCPGYKYRIRPDGHSTYVWYAPGWPGNPHPHSGTGSDKRVREEDLEARYRGEWFDAYLDWTARFEEALLKAGHRHHHHHHQQQQAGSSKRPSPFADEGERTLWMVEGLLLACWLSLQGDVGAVEYQPAEEVYVLEKGDVGVAVRRFLDAVRI